MKNVLYILNDGLRKFTYERTAGLYRAIQRAEEPINLYIVRSDGYAGFAPSHNQGEYNIFRLPDYRDFDGIFLDINRTVDADANAFAAQGVLYAVEAALASGKPVVSMANLIDGAYYVGIDNRDAMTRVIAYLHDDMGLTDFWFAMGPVDNYECGIRAGALKDYCLAHGLPCGDDRFYYESYIMECGAHAFAKLCADHPGKLPQAVICANDQIAVGVCHAAEAAGYAVPRDFAVTGFDNLDLSAYLSPSITTIDQLAWNMGDACVDTMCRIWRGEDVPRVINTPTKLLLRESTGHPDPGREDMKEEVCEFMRRSSAATEFSYRLSDLQARLPGCGSIKEICLRLTECVSPLKCKGLYLVLDRDLYEYGGKLDFGDRSGECTEGLATEGYTDDMELVFAWEVGKPPWFPHRRVGSHLNTAKPKGPRENHMYVPIHFIDRAVGYLAIWDCVEMMRIKYVSTIVNTLTMALRSFFARRRLAYANDVLAGVSMKDDLTGLYNRLGLHDMGLRLFRKVSADGGRLGVVFLDMDKLKLINDTYGHASGDQAIRCVGNAMLRCAGKDAVPVRYGGDEFLLLTPAAGEDEVVRLIAAIEAAVPAEAKALGVEEPPGVSAGYVLTDPEADRTLEDYVAEADARMYEVKKTRKGE
ncbi:MAG: diguanylate cyclase [Clostridia bacterium]|nr:diguanylate cyclase [Clostridia bacterium]